MEMSLDEAIKHAEEVAEEQEKLTKEWHENQVRKCELIPFAEMDYTHENECKVCAAEHRQLAEWLKELKDYRERTPFYEAGYNDAKREIALSGEYERAYERGKADAQPKTEVLDKIRAEIRGKYRVILKNIPKDDWAVKWNQCLDEVLQIMEKYTAESEE